MGEYLHQEPAFLTCFLLNTSAAAARGILRQETVNLRTSDGTSTKVEKLGEIAHLLGGGKTIDTSALRLL